jgi:hypothetical protein
MPPEMSAPGPFQLTVKPLRPESCAVKESVCETWYAWDEVYRDVACYGAGNLALDGLLCLGDALERCTGAGAGIAV